MGINRFPDLTYLSSHDIIIVIFCNYCVVGL